MTDAAQVKKQKQHQQRRRYTPVHAAAAVGNNNICPDRMIFDPVTQLCYHISDRKNPIVQRLVREQQQELDVKLERAQWENSLKAALARRVKVREIYRHKWTLQPGDVGFNAEATQMMREAKVNAAPFEVTCPSSSGTAAAAATVDLPYQRTAAFLVHPESPMTRVLVNVRTGGGKTLIMIRILSNFYDDIRPKLAVFPSDAIARQFYSEIMAFENPYRSYVLDKMAQMPRFAAAAAAAIEDLAQRASARRLTAEEVQIADDILALKGHPGSAGQPGFLAAPFRSVSYNQMGGKTLANSNRWMQPRGTYPHVGGSVNIWCEKIVLMDEAHNLVKPNPKTVTLEVSRANLAHAREMLYHARNSVLALFTATPVVDDPQDADDLMAIVRGVDNAAKSNEGFITAFVGSPASAYPTLNPGIANPSEREMPIVVPVPLTGNPNNPSTSLGNYLRLILVGPRGSKRVDPKALAKSTRDIYEYTAAYFQGQTQATFLAKLQTDPQSVAPKLYWTAKYMQKEPGKVIALVNSPHGFFSLFYMIENCDEFALDLRGKVIPLLGSKTTTRRDFAPADCGPYNFNRPADYAKCAIGRFNDDRNINGQDVRGLILNAEEYSEGVDFQGVRAIINVDIPESWSRLKQRIGRAVRNCSHRKLPRESWTVATYMLCATLPPYVQLDSGQVLDLRPVSTRDEEQLISIMMQRSAVETKNCALVNSAVDREILRPVSGDDVCSGGQHNQGQGQGSHNREDARDVATRKAQIANATADIAMAYKNYARCVEVSNRLLKHQTANMYAEGRGEGKLEQVAAAMTKCKDALVAEVDRIVAEQVPWFTVDAPNCPIAYLGNEEQCSDFCESAVHPGDGTRLSAQEVELCKGHVNLPRPATPMATADDRSAMKNDDGEFATPREDGMDVACSNCPEGEPHGSCMTYCNDQGYRSHDYYKCVARLHDGSTMCTSGGGGAAAAGSGSGVAGRAPIVVNAAAAGKKPAAAAGAAKKPRRRASPVKGKEAAVGRRRGTKGGGETKPKPKKK